MSALPISAVTSGSGPAAATRPARAFRDVLQKTQPVTPETALAAPIRTANPTPARWLGQVAAAQRRLDFILEQARSGKSFTPAELLALQTQVYRSSQELDFAGKLVDKATAGVKQILQTPL
jgi:hypothetical protein